MNKSIVSRLLWKEYRMQRGLWLAMLIALPIFVGLFRLFAFGISQERDRTALLGIAIGLSWMLTFCYAFGAGAITFAIEREESTQVRLLSLGCPPGLTLTLKALFGIVMSGLLFAINLMIGIGIAGGVTDEVWNGLKDLDVSVAVIPASLLCGFLWAIFYSLLTRSVLVALGLAVASIAVSSTVGIGVLGNSFQLDPSRQGILAIIQFGIQLLLLCPANYFLARRWLSHEFVDRPRVGWRPWRWAINVYRGGIDGSVAIEIGSDRDSESLVLSPDAAAAERPPRRVLGWLNARRSSRWGRLLWMLVWKEAAETRRLYLWFLGPVLVVTGLAATTLGHPPGGDYALIALALYGAALGCGTLAFRSEQRDQVFRFLTGRGASGGQVWLSKQLVWLLRLVIAETLILAVTLTFCPTWADFVRFNTDVFSWAPGSRTGGWSNATALESVGRLVACLLIPYAIAQTASHGVKQTIVACFAGLLGFLLTVGWATFCTVWGIPIWCSVGPLLPGLFLQTRRRTRRWLLEQPGQKAWLESHFTIAGSILCCFLACGAYRVSEVPLVEPLVTLASDGTVLLNRLSAVERIELMRVPDAAEIETGRLYLALSEQIGPIHYDAFKPENIQEAAKFDREMRYRWARSYGELLAELQKLLESSTSPAWPAESSDPPTIGFNDLSLPNRLLSVIATDEVRLADMGELRAALDRFRQYQMIDLQIIRNELQFRRVRRVSGLHLRRQSLLNWSRYKGVTPELEAEAELMIRSGRDAMPSVSARLFVAHRAVEELLEADAGTLGYRMTAGSAFSSSWIQSFVLNLPFERARCRRLLALTERRLAEDAAVWSPSQLASNSWLEHLRSSGDQRAPSDGMTEAGLSQILERTPILRGVYDVYPEVVYRMDTDDEADARGTVLAMRLNLAKNQSGQWPESLDGIDDGIRDPWNGSRFQWFPHGIPHEVEVGSKGTIPADEPVLLCGGQYDVHLVPEVTGVASADSISDSSDPPSIRFRFLFKDRTGATRRQQESGASFWLLNPQRKPWDAG